MRVLGWWHALAAAGWLAGCMPGGQGAMVAPARAPIADAGSVAEPGPVAVAPSAAATIDAAGPDAGLLVPGSAGGEPGDPPPVPDAEGPAAEIARSITFTNLEPGETVPHDLVMIAGTVAGGGKLPSGIDLSLGGRTSTWPVIDGHFRALTQLSLGSNDLTFTVGASTTTLRLRYLPSDNPRYVRFLYIVAADGDGSFEGAPGEPNDQASALARLRVGARLMQSFLAETMRSAGFGRRTFRLLRDVAGDPVVQVWKTKLTNAQARAMDGNALWNAFYRELEALPDRDLSLDVAVMAMTHYDPASKTKLAHTALGGGRLGLFGSGTLFAHAAAVADITRAFSDTRAVDTARLPDDSAGRATIWANYATGIGAMEHELGHALSLPHPASHSGLMWRGFDHFNRTFMIAEPGSALSSGMAPVLTGDESGIDRSNAVRLRYHRWLAPGKVAYAVTQPTQIAVDATTLTIASPAGVRHIQYLVDGEAVTHDEFLAAAPAQVTIPLAALRERIGPYEIDVTAIDDAGNIGSRDRITLP